MRSALIIKNMQLIQITTKGIKGRWWNKFIDNYFLAKDKDTSWEIVYLSNIYGNVCGTNQMESNVPKEYCRKCVK